MRIIFVTGPSCSGKSTYVDETSKVLDDPVVLRPGRIVRDVWGEKFLVNNFTGPACNLLEDVVRSLVTSHVSLCLEINKSLVIDGFPRTMEQLSMVNHYAAVSHSAMCGWVGKSPACVEVVFIIPPPDVLRERISKRTGEEGPDFELATMNIKSGTKIFEDMITKFKKIPTEWDGKITVLRDY